MVLSGAGDAQGYGWFYGQKQHGGPVEIPNRYCKRPRFLDFPGERLCQVTCFPKSGPPLPRGGVCGATAIVQGSLIVPIIPTWVGFTS
jgi:hypothetical protein